MDKKLFYSELKKDLKTKYRTDIKNAKSWQLHECISTVVMEYISDDWTNSLKAHYSQRHACYFSMEFLMGRAVYNNLLCLGITDEVEDILKSENRSLSELEDISDAALGNGGLGRLAACFLDSAAAHNLPLDGYGIRYKYGLFKQTIKDGFQYEEADNWTKYGDPWSKRCEEDAVIVEYADQKVKAVPYDMPIIGFGTRNIGNLRLWQAEAYNDFDFAAFDKGDYDGAVSSKNSAENISKVLYPNDNCEEGKILRLKQEYFFSAASVADLIRKHKARFASLDNLSDYLAIQLNDTHPVIAIPEFVRQLTDNEGYTFENAFETAKKIFSYTNHTIMTEALEKWDCRLIEKILPRVYRVMIMINEHFIKEMYGLGIDKNKIKELAPISGGMVNMAYLASYTGSYINGVAAIHTEILKNNTLKDWYKIYPQKFQNKTNGITQRRWLALCNKELSALITKLLGNADWVKNLDELKKLEKYADDENVLREFIAVKSAKKHELAEYIKNQDGIEINPDTIFDIQIKRLHEYKRQLMNALSILYIYYGIKDGSIRDFTPTTYIFGAKSAPGYKRAKAIIKFINEIGKLVNNDPDTKDLIKIVFISNYNVSYAEKLVTAADLSEQISTAGTEASGTGNMKLMLNGACTLGTYDGANIEIVEQAGAENNYIFGAKVEELEKISSEYNPRSIIFSNEKIRRVINKLIDGSFDDGGKASNEEGSFAELYKSLTDGASWHSPDHYYILGDLESYVSAKLKAGRDYKNELLFARKCWLNICNAGKFSSDRTVKDYAENIWNISPI